MMVVQHSTRLTQSWNFNCLKNIFSLFWIWSPVGDKLQSDGFFNSNNVTHVNWIASSTLRVNFNNFQQWVLVHCLPYLKTQNCLKVVALSKCHIFQNVLEVKGLVYKFRLECVQGLILFPIFNISQAQYFIFVHTWDQYSKLFFGTIWCHHNKWQAFNSPIPKANFH